MILHPILVLCDVCRESAILDCYTELSVGITPLGGPVEVGEIVQRVSTEDGRRVLQRLEAVDGWKTCRVEGGVAVRPRTFLTCVTCVENGKADAHFQSLLAQLTAKQKEFDERVARASQPLSKPDKPTP
jgi:hypothetical protein